jgi:colanic acid/amylovoran biosynthesis glycosyltransferase
MRILFYSDYFGGNTTTFIYNEVVGLAKNHTVKYICLERENPDKFPFENVEILEWKLNPFLRKIRWILEKNGIYLSFRNRNFSSHLKRIIKEFKPDIIQCHFAYEALRITDNLPQSKIPVVITFQGHDASYHIVRSSYVRKLKELALRPDVSTTFVTSYLKKRIEEKGVFFKNAAVIYSGIRTDLFKRNNYNVSDTFIFLQVSGFEKRKGQHITLQAFKKLTETTEGKHCRLVLAGNATDPNSSYYNDTKNMAITLGISQLVEFPGWISPQEAKEVMEKAGCFVHHSITVNNQTEGIPNAIIEAMAMELPVISTYHAGIPELVENGVNGFLVNENDVESYAACMFEMLHWKYQEKNREKVLRSFELSKRISALESYYKQLLDIR